MAIVQCERSALACCCEQPDLLARANFIST
jgi:hypothetical protein